MKAHGRSCENRAKRNIRQDPKKMYAFPEKIVIPRQSQEDKRQLYLESVFYIRTRVPVL